MFIKYHATLTIEVNEKPNSESEWEKFNIELEKQIESSLEDLDHIKQAEIVIEELD